MPYTLIPTSWHDNRDSLSQVRCRVFIEEQHVPRELEWDEFDQSSFHVLAQDDRQQPIGTGRLKPDGQIGRMAVIPEYRNQGVGSAILAELLRHAESLQLEQVYLHAQTSAIAFYEKHGFEVCSDEFIDAGIPHRTMKIQLNSGDRREP